ncbi:unnamed protein product [Heterosigma akashiwo]
MMSSTEALVKQRRNPDKTDVVRQLHSRPLCCVDKKMVSPYHLLQPTTSPLYRRITEEVMKQQSARSHGAVKENTVMKPLSDKRLRTMWRTGWNITLLVGSTIRWLWTGTTE